MASVLRAASANEWWDNLNTVRTKLGLSTVSGSFGTDNIAKNSDMNNYVTNMNALKDNTYASYAEWMTLSAPGANYIIKESLKTNVDTMADRLLKICPNTVTANGGMATSFSVEGTRTSTSFSVTSFTKTLDCSREAVAGNSNRCTNCTDCGRRTGTTYSNTGCSFRASNCSGNTGNSTERSYNGLSNTSRTNFSKQENNSQRANSNFSDFTRNTRFSRQATTSNTNFTRFSETRANPCNNTATTNSVTAQTNVFTGFSVRG